MQCSFQAPARAWSRHFSVVIARGPHLFPFRTEQLSPSAPMVLGPRGPGRVGRRRSLLEGPPLGAALRRCPDLTPHDSAAAMSTLAIVLIVLRRGRPVLCCSGFLGTRARDRRQAGTWEEAVRAADAALAQAAATDRGWHRESMEAAARTALAEIAARLALRAICTSCSWTTARASRRTAHSSWRSATTATRPRGPAAPGRPLVRRARRLARRGARASPRSPASRLRPSSSER